VSIATELGARAADTTAPRQRTALLGLRCLAAFAEKQFQLFATGFARGVLEADPRYPQAFLMEATARQVSFDIDILLRAVAQRDAAGSTAAMRETLALADQLAARALAPAMRHGLIEETAILTYFQKSPTIRLIPYAPLAAIGFDLSATHDRTRLIAIAHEAGHHVYRQLTVNYAADLDEQIEGRAADALSPTAWPAWLLAWEEEIFADVYSVLIAGPVAGLAMQQMVGAELPAVLTYDDGDHPLAALRPEITPAVLRQLAVRSHGGQQQKLVQTADQLEQRWRAYLLAQGTATAFQPAGSTEPVLLEAARMTLASYVEELLARELAPLAAEESGTAWSEAVAAADPTALSEITAQFERGLAQLDGSPLPELEARGKARVAVSPQVKGVRGGDRLAGQIGDPYLDELRDDALAGKRVLTTSEWQAVFLAGDWVTEEGGSGILPVRRRLFSVRRKQR
jgi:hypothetical protein